MQVAPSGRLVAKVSIVTEGVPPVYYSLKNKKDNLFSKGVNDSSKVSTCSVKRLSTTSGNRVKTVNQNQEKTLPGYMVTV